MLNSLNDDFEGVFSSSCSSGFVPVSLIKQQQLRRALLKASSMAFLCLLQPHLDRLHSSASRSPRNQGFQNHQIWFLCSSSASSFPDLPCPRFFWLLPPPQFQNQEKDGVATRVSDFFLCIFQPLWLTFSYPDSFNCAFSLSSWALWWFE